MASNELSNIYDTRFDYKRLPAWVLESIEAYVLTGRPLGGFLTACFANDLQHAFGRADLTMYPLIGTIAAFIYNRVPSPCHGSYDIVEKWIEQGGLPEGVFWKLEV